MTIGGAIPRPPAFAGGSLHRTACLLPPPSLHGSSKNPSAPAALLPRARASIVKIRPDVARIVAVGALACNREREFVCVCVCVCERERDEIADKMCLSRARWPLLGCPLFSRVTTGPPVHASRRVRPRNLPRRDTEGAGEGARGEGVGPRSFSRRGAARRVIPISAVTVRACRDRRAGRAAPRRR